jgi:hypothetical protein
LQKLCVCVCVRKKERKKEIEIERETETEMYTCMPKQLESLKAHLLLTRGVHKQARTDNFKLHEDKELQNFRQNDQAVRSHIHKLQRKLTQKF